MTYRTIGSRDWRLLAIAFVVVLCGSWGTASPGLQDGGGEAGQTVRNRKSQGPRKRERAQPPVEKGAPVQSEESDAAAAPDGEEDTQRRIWDRKFLESREQGGAKTRPKKRPAAAPSVKLTSTEGELVGVTIWRLKEGAGNDDQGKEVFERAQADTAFSAGERVRLSIEAPRDNDSYLYVIDREVYADGSMGDPYLIFPSQTTPPGGNVVAAGKMIYVPAQGDPISYFTLDRTRKDHVKEALTIIITPFQLTLPPGAPANPRLKASQVAQWEKQYGGRVEKREERNGAGKLMTAETRGVDDQRRLRQNDPLPQTIYHIKVKPGAPLALNVPLLIAP
ncbi:MAG TPA: hypothetical protein VJ302_00320 [Blastocatellia bacterium]|nr:hypothetical protein [Blastocatellia bacterium]